MAYRKTEQVLLEIEGRKERVVNAALVIIKKHGTEALTSSRVAKVSRQSVGLIYKHFPDMDELRAHVFALLLSRDVELLRQAGDLPLAIRSWTSALSSSPRLASALAGDAAYRVGVKRELARIIRSTGAEHPNVLAAVVCGAVLEASRSSLATQGSQLTTALLRACGIRSKANA